RAVYSVKSSVTLGFAPGAASISPAIFLATRQKSSGPQIINALAAESVSTPYVSPAGRLVASPKASRSDCPACAASRFLSRTISYVDAPDSRPGPADPSAGPFPANALTIQIATIRVTK